MTIEIGSHSLDASGSKIYRISVDDFTIMNENHVISQERQVFLWDGRLFEKMAKTKAHAAVHDAISWAISRRLPPGLFVGNEHPIQLDETHLPLPDLVVVRGNPLDFFDTRYPDGRDVLLVVEIAVSSLLGDLGERLKRFARTLPEAAYVVADVAHRRVLVHTQPRAEGDPAGGGYEVCSVAGPGEAIALRLGDFDLEPIPYDEVMR